ncbi:MAG: 23S rRNA (guanosine(2251)-2'-O)-methyltransferase RlmB [bacterium]|nr:23S rRNA (guanosine(2251)-2'-O)-methyltransferase RlmB [bacterium]
MIKRPHTREKIYIYGKHALNEALSHAPHSLRKVYLSPENSSPELLAELGRNKIAAAELSRDRAGELLGKEASHQGIIALVDPSALLISFEDFLRALPSSGLVGTAVAVLAEVQDPHNVGAIIRSAAAFGLSAVLIPEHRQAPITGAVVKASAGMAFRIPLVSIGNVNHALEVLKKKGFWTYGLSMRGTTALAEEAFDAPAAFVVGNEGHGVREKTLLACDIELTIPMNARSESLNAAAAAAVVFYGWSAKHPGALLRSEATGGQAL